MHQHLLPEFLDLLILQSSPPGEICGNVIGDDVIQRPIVLRIVSEDGGERTVTGKRIDACDVHHPFHRFALPDRVNLAAKLMLTGKLPYHRLHEREIGHRCLSFIAHINPNTCL
ncbi:MAG: hypothetical protein C4326_01445 [Ignavibacteria bacterium]